MRYFRVPVLLAGLCLLLTGDHAQQPRTEPSSHELLPGVIDRNAAEKRLGDRFQSSADKNPLALLESLLKNPERYGIDPKAVEKIAREVGKRPQDFGINPTDPDVQDMARRLAAQAKFNPAQLDALKRLIPNIKPPDPDKPDIDKPVDKDKKPDTDKDKKPDTDKPSDKDKKPDTDKPGDMGKVTPPVPPQGSRPPGDPVIKPAPSAKNKNRSWIAEQFSSLMGKDGITGDLRDWLRGLTGPDTWVGDASRGLSREMKLLTGKILPNLDGIRLDTLWRDIREAAPRLDVSFSPPSFSGPSMPSGEDFGPILLGIALLGAIGFGFFLLARSRGWSAGPRGDGWRLGPWPVAPAAVRTRDDVVKAFEYLALLLLGRQVSASNHLDIAKQLATRDQTGQGRQAAGELAELYEHARYAPPEETLSDAEMESARRDLTFLAGVAAA